MSLLVDIISRFCALWITAAALLNALHLILLLEHELALREIHWLALIREALSLG